MAFFNSEIDFIKSLMNIGNAVSCLACFLQPDFVLSYLIVSGYGLKGVDPDKRKQALMNELENLNRNLPENVYLPFFEVPSPPPALSLSLFLFLPRRRE
jgi:hypothetical protein